LLFSLGINVINLTTGVKYGFLIVVKPIVPLAEIVNPSLATLKIFEKHNNPSLFSPLE